MCGGDGPESVNQALHEAVTKISWNDSDDVLKIIFLVGDAPPHMDYDNDVHYPEVCRLAVKRNLIINTIQCGNETETTTVWQEIARSAEGEFVQLEQSGGMVAIATPVDAQLAELNAQLGLTIVPFGDRRERESALAKQSAAEAAPASVAADRLAYNTASRKVVQGNEELIDALDEGRIKLEDVKDEQLPEEMRAMSATQRQEHIEKLRAQRAELQAKVTDLLQQRQAYIDTERRRLAESGNGDAFDQKITEVVRAQVREKE